MKLQLDPFEKIKNGSKTLELRLNDEKRQLIKIGDKIEFSLTTEPTQKILAIVEDLYHFPTFKDLCYSFEPAEYGSLDKEGYLEMYKYYSKEDEAKYGVLGIRIRPYEEHAVKIFHYQVPTKEAEALKNALIKRGIKVYVELHDGYKTIDLTIPNAKINIEVDGVQHLTDPKQILADLGRGYYSHKNGYDTMHITNQMICAHLDDIADALAQAAKIREQKIFVYSEEAGIKSPKL